MIISENLLKEVMSEFQSKKELDCVIENSLPVLFFGDLKSYVKNDFKVVTAAINPSDMEFKKERKQLANPNKKGSPKGNREINIVEKMGLEPTTS